jgi:hypothetical protein
MWDHEKNGWVTKDEKIWDCDVLSATEDGENCMESKACKHPESTCFRKNYGWASCNKSCSHNKMWDHDKKEWVTKDEKVWDCHVLSATKDGDNCIESRSCLHPESRCYKKNEDWASCNRTCSIDQKWEDDKWVTKMEKVWDCKILSCTHDGESCLDSRCCKSPESKCYRKNEHWASCNRTCSHNMLWENGKWVDKGTPFWNCTELLPNGKDTDQDSADDTEDGLNGGDSDNSSSHST